MLRTKVGFTLVELIVVTTIVAILAATGFVSYTKYVDTGRDTNRILQLTDIREGMQLYSVRNLLPEPEQSIIISANGNPFAYQGNLSENIINTIGYQGGGKDVENQEYPVYMLSKNRKDFQIMTFLSNSENISLFSQSYAEVDDYSVLYPKVTGSPLGILLEAATQTPLHLLTNVASVGGYDIVLGTESVYSYLSDTDYIDGSVSLLPMIPNQSCKRILNMGNSKGSTIYTISPDGNQKIRVYCDMDTDGGGWTFFGHVNQNTRGTDFSFNSAVGTYKSNREDDDTTYSINASMFIHEEMMVTLDTPDALEAQNSSKIVFYKYEKGASGFYTGPITCSGLNGSFEFKITIDSEYEGPGVSNACGGSNWYTRDGSGYLTLFHANPNGNYWGASMGGNNSWSHDGWWYVR